MSSSARNEWKRCKRKVMNELLQDDDDTTLQTLSKRPAVASQLHFSSAADVRLSESDDHLLEFSSTTDSASSVCAAPSLASTLQSKCDNNERFDERFDFDSLADTFDFDHNDVDNPFPNEDLNNLRSLFEDDPKDTEDTALRSDLVVWALEHKIGRNALTDLLHILRAHNHPNLPLCSKTLLKTPRSTVKMFKTLGDGLFWYYGILVNLVPRLTEGFLEKLNGTSIAIDIFIDGVSPYKSVKKVLWPICASLAGSKDIFIIAMWCGRTKEPSDLSLFLEDFLSEAKELMLGFTHLGRNLKLVLRNIIADAPARTWLKNVNQHGSYYACERCTAVGQWIANRMTYHPHEETLPRTDESLRKQTDRRYHKGPTPLTELENFSLISQIPLEPMHLLNLGIMRRILTELLGTKRNNCRFKFSDLLKSVVDNMSEYIARFYPSDFARRPRKWSDYALFKATELRRILLYDGLLILKARGVSKKVYHNYLLLCCAIRILSDPLLVRDFADDAAVLLKKFVSDSVLVYGQKFNVYNVHHLVHLSEECKRHGDLELFSAYKYENHLGVLKRLLHAPGRTLSQIVCRLLEVVSNRPPNAEEVQHEVIVSRPYELPASLNHLGKGFNSLSIVKSKITLLCNSFFLSCEKEVVQISNIIKTDESFLLVGKKFKHQIDYFTRPLPSSCLDIYEVRKLGEREFFTVNQVLKKCVVVPIPTENHFPSSVSDGPCLAMSMLHGGD
ncbi:uncharacterized protein LOC113207099 [Frankliniella occidentalis]|uniref:Uncharacterized protein LOC113207099 n=1 Tax=Frankliniella occidentalis TaxID=133901 RepID=A0A6J1SF03_FRAOC|nr:uncharacterized protein LOC113207099 [Frankliniella occidentalis]